MSLRDIFNRIRNVGVTPRPLIPHYAVIDSSDNTLVAIGTYSPALFFLNESMMDTEYVPGIPSADVLSVKMSGLRAYPEWSWDRRGRTFKKTNPDIITDDMRDRAVLAAKKVEAVGRVIYWINRLRAKTNTGLLFQAAIYTEKERQALGLKEADFDERRAAAPYVVEYADATGISLREATEEILLQARLDHEQLAKTEKLRLALFRKIRAAKTPEEVGEIVDTFRNEGTV